MLYPYTFGKEICFLCTPLVITKSPGMYSNFSIRFTFQVSQSMP